MKQAFITILMVSLLLSCREEIIEPGNFAGNINEPIQLNTRNSFTFLINAEEFTMNLTESASFNTSAARVSITLIDCESGTVFIGVRDSDNRERYRHSLSNDVNNYTDIMEGFIPSSIHIRTVSLTGKLKIQLTNAF